MPRKDGGSLSGQEGNLHILTCAKWKRATCQRQTFCSRPEAAHRLRLRGTVRARLGLLPPFDHAARIMIRVRVGPDLLTPTYRLGTKGVQADTEGESQLASDWYNGVGQITAYAFLHEVS